MALCQIQIGTIVGPKGIRGQFKVKPYTETPAALSAYGPVTTDDDQQLTLQIMSVNAKGLAIVSAEEITSREAAEALRGASLFIARDLLPVLDDGEFYHVDLIGMNVRGQDGNRLGTLIGIHDFGAGEIAELAPHQGSTIMVPFGRNWLMEADMEEKELRLFVPEGLLADFKR